MTKKKTKVPRSLLVRQCMIDCSTNMLEYVQKHFPSEREIAFWEARVELYQGPT